MTYEEVNFIRTLTYDNGIVEDGDYIVQIGEINIDGYYHSIFRMLVQNL
jgi:hypothetical protein